jgi:hypothetical protein
MMGMGNRMTHKERACFETALSIDARFEKMNLEET